MAVEDRAYFKAGVKTLCGTELLFAGNVINDKDLRKQFDAEDLEFMNKELGRQAGEMLNNNLLYVCSPYRGEIRRNKEYARELTKAAINAGFAPVTVHLYLTEVLDDNKPQERSRGMAAGQDILKRCSYILLGEKYGISEGMKEEIMLAALKGLTMLYEKDGTLYYAGTQKEAISI